MSNFQILSLLSQYELLERTAQYLTPLDLLHLASTCSEIFTLIRKSESIFERLKRVALCDGRGLQARQNFQRLYTLRYFRFPNSPAVAYDEEIEVRLWNLKCDAANGLPCVKCGFNVCEECRYVPRTRDGPDYESRRRPHLDPAYESHDIVCYCTECDAEVERNLPLRLSEYCDCDQYTRWICLTCREKEKREDRDYYETRTQIEWERTVPIDVWDAGMVRGDHQFLRAFWCPCGKRPHIIDNVRCTWCKRRHNTETWREDCSSIPFFDDDPCYPKFVATRTFTGYPTLGYTGPIAP